MPMKANKICDQLWMTISWPQWYPESSVSPIFLTTIYFFACMSLFFSFLSFFHRFFRHNPSCFFWHNLSCFF